MDRALSLPLKYLADRQALSPLARSEIDRLLRPRPGRFLWTLLLTWGTIVGSIWLAVAWQRVWVTAIVIVVVATRQLVLGFLMHEQTHCLAFRARGGDLLTNLLVAYPLLVITLEGYAEVHLAHHRHFFTLRDPDFVRKSGPDWAAPMSPGRLSLLLLTDFLGLNVWRLIQGKKVARPTASFPRPSPTATWIRPAYYGVAASVITLTGTWQMVLLYWIVPLVTVTQLLVRWGALCEHLYNLPNAAVAEASPIIVLRWWERLLMPNLNFTLHPYHHYFPGVPFSSLPEVHAIFRREHLVDQRYVFHGNLAYLRFILQR